VLCDVFQTSGEFAVRVMRMIDSYGLTSARQLVPGQQMTVVVNGIGQSHYCVQWRSQKGGRNAEIYCKKNLTTGIIARIYQVGKNGRLKSVSPLLCQWSGSATVCDLCPMRIF